MKKSLSDKLPLWHLDGDLIIFSDGSLGQGFKLTGFDISCLSNDVINQFSLNIENLLVGAADGTRLQVFYRLTGNLKEVILNHVAVSKGAPGQYQPIAEARHSFLEQNYNSKNYFVPEIYLFVRSEAIQFKKKKFFEKRTDFCQTSQTQYSQHKEKFLRTLTQIESGLRQARLEPKRLNKCEWFNLVFEYFNLSRLEKLGPPTLQESVGPTVPPISEQLILTDVEISKTHLKVGDLLFRILTLKTPPEGHTFSAMVDQFTKLPFHFWLSQNLKILNQRKEIEKLELGRRLTHSMVSGKQNVSDLEGESRLSQMEELLRELLGGNERLISMDFNIVIWGETETELQDRTDDVLRAFRAMNQSEGLCESLPAFDIFLNAAPSFCEGFRHKKMKSSNAAHLMPLYSNWRGNLKPVCVIPNREGSLFSIDPFAKELPNWNGLIFGGSGGGKSFTVSQIALQFYGQNPTPKIIWIDNGESSRRLVEVLDGEFIDLNLESGITLNMFDLEAGDKKPSASKIKLILGALEMILKDEETKGLPKREKALLEEAIFKTYALKKEGSIPILSDLREILKNHPVGEMNKFSQILYSWTGDTAYGRMLDRQSNVKLTKNLISIEIKGLDNHRDLKDLFLLLFTSFIKQEAARDLSTPYLLIVDECARLFRTPTAKDFIIECFRVFRKYNAGIYCLSQNYKDFLSDSELADSLMPNTTNVFILRQKKIDWNDFQERFDFNDAQIEVIKSLEIVKGKYSEFFFMQDENQTVLRLIPEPLSYWICTTDGNDKARIKAKEDQNSKLSKIEILKLLAREGIEVHPNFENEPLKEAA